VPVLLLPPDKPTDNRIGERGRVLPLMFRD